ncbi:recombinase family protein [Roseomonas genomospecies 6]|uniref:Resolvase/invertase-type recombinase catalytic domain-containing protein n=1 Tax=Roseomonas genomospecies 6 TaxID=214106 RepID=A0A9W7KS93_9PROT|nr:recombinase family protein [Roseomonas genomospecies 6]KAA0677694.1 hypothetical protein DS843_22915 [Roseomonas genomospecies 6]
MPKYGIEPRTWTATSYKGRMVLSAPTDEIIKAAVDETYPDAVFLPGMGWQIPMAGKILAPDMQKVIDSIAKVARRLVKEQKKSKCIDDRTPSAAPAQIWGWARSSTKSQNPAYQVALLMAAGVPEKNIAWEFVSGGAAVMKELDNLVAKMRANDILLMTAPSRLGRDLRLTTERLNYMLDKKIIVKTLFPELDTSIPGDKGRFLSAITFAEYAWLENSALTSIGQRHARQKGVAIGRKRKMSLEQIDAAAVAFACGKATKASIKRRFGIADSTYYSTVYRKAKQIKRQCEVLAET